MSRSGYSDYCEHLELWRSNVERTINGKNGQIFILDLIKALDAMPEKKLIRGSLINETGEVCAIGALGLKRGVDMTHLDPDMPDEVATAFGISSMLAQEVVYQNDDRRESDTPEERWARIRTWAEQNLRSRQTTL